jgi:hypothetical protein
MTPEVTPYDAVIADLEMKRDQINSMIESLRQMKAFVNSLGFPTVQSPGVKPPETAFAHDAFFGMTIQDAAKSILQARRKTMPHPELCDAMLAGGLKTSATNFRETARAGLSRNTEFVKVNTEWGLAEWYPGLRRDKKKRPAQNSEQPEEDNSREPITIPVAS